MSEITLAAANMIVTHDKRQNLSTMLRMMDEAHDQGVDVLVFPEVGLQGYADFAYSLGERGVADQKRYYAETAESIPGPATETIRERAAKYGMFVQIGMAEKSLHSNVVFNSTALIGPEGVIGVYRKIHNQFEFPYFSPGNSTAVFDLPFARVGSLICYDLAFPELMRVFALQGARIGLHSTAWPMKGHDMTDDYYGTSMDLSAKANAFFNQCWLVISNHCETGAYSQGIDYWGNSQIVDPFGTVVAQLGREEGLVVHTADLDATISESRNNGFFGLNLLHDRRPEHYGVLVDDSGYAPTARPPARFIPDSVPQPGSPVGSTSQGGV